MNSCVVCPGSNFDLYGMLIICLSYAYHMFIILKYLLTQLIKDNVFLALISVNRI